MEEYTMLSSIDLFEPNTDSWIAVFVMCKLYVNFHFQNDHALVSNPVNII